MHSFIAKIKGLYQRELSNGNRPSTPHDALGIFKPMLLGQWHGLSDTQLDLQTLAEYEQQYGNYTALYRLAPSYA